MTYKLTYFNLRGLGEPIRFLLHYMGQEFEDVRIEVADWPNRKQESPFGKVPMLEIGSEKYTDSVAICRFLGHEAGLAGDNPRENAAIDQVIGAIGDLMMEARKVTSVGSEEDKEKAKKELVNVSIPFYFDRFEKIAKENGGYLANGKLSWVDFYFVAWSENLVKLAELDLPNKYPTCYALQQKILNLPAIKEWVQKRPETPM